MENFVQKNLNSWITWLDFFSSDFLETEFKQKFPPSTKFLAFLQKSAKSGTRRRLRRRRQRQRQRRRRRRRRRRHHQNLLRWNFFAFFDSKISSRLKKAFSLKTIALENLALQNCCHAFDRLSLSYIRKQPCKSGFFAAKVGCFKTIKLEWICSGISLSPNLTFVNSSGQSNRPKLNN